MIGYIAQFDQRYYIVHMAKINKVSANPQYWKVKITVEDPDCNFSIDPQISFEKVVKAANENAAIRAAANYCTKQMKEYEHTEFKYDPHSAIPYYYSFNNPATKEDL